MLSINWALKLLTRNSGLSCLKTQSGSWKHCRFLDLWKLASSMRVLTALCIWYSGEAIWNNPCLVSFFFLSLSLSHCLFLSLVLSYPFMSFSVFLLSLSLMCSHTHTSFPPPAPDFFFFFLITFKWYGPSEGITKLRGKYAGAGTAFFVTRSDN